MHNYYPFGLEHKGYNTATSSFGNDKAEQRKFGGKELQSELGLGWYDITARNYDPALGRWMNLDPLGELMNSKSPFNFTFNNPIKFVDRNGMNPTDPPGSGTDEDPIELEEVTVVAGQEASSSRSRGVNFYMGSMFQWKSDYGYSGSSNEDARMAYWNTYGNSYQTPQYNALWNVDATAFKANWNMGYKGWEQGSIGVFLMDVTTYAIGGTLVSTVLLPEMIAGGGYYSALSKTTFSAGAQYLINDGKINIVAAIADGILIPGASDAIGAGFEVNYNFKTREFNTRSILSNPSMVNGAYIDAAISTVFSIKASAISNSIKNSDASEIAKNIGEAATDLPMKSASYGAQKKY